MRSGVGGSRGGSGLGAQAKALFCPASVAVESPLSSTATSPSPLRNATVEPRRSMQYLGFQPRGKGRIARHGHEQDLKFLSSRPGADEGVTLGQRRAAAQ